MGSFASGPRAEWSDSRNVFNDAPGPSNRHQWDCSTQNPAVIILDDESVVMAYRAHACVDGWPAPYPETPPNEYIGLATAPGQETPHSLAIRTCVLVRWQTGLVVATLRT